MKTLNAASIQDVLMTVDEYLSGNKVFRHSENVYQICRNIVNRFCDLDPSVYINVDMLYKSALLHDIGKAECLRGKFKKKNHAISSAIVISILFECSTNQITSDYYQRLSSIILAHNGEFNPPQEVILESAILRIADKIEKYYDPNESNAQNHYDNSINAILEYCSNEKNCLFNLSILIQACDYVRKDVKKEVGANCDT